MNYLESDTPFYYGNEYEVYTDANGDNICRAIQTNPNQQSEVQDYTTTNNNAPAAVATTSTNVENDDEETTTDQPDVSNQTVEYNPKTPENFTPEIFVSFLANILENRSKSILIFSIVLFKEYSGTDLCAVEGKNLCSYAANVAKVLFTVFELQNGHIVDILNKTKKKKAELDENRIQILKGKFYS